MTFFVDKEPAYRALRILHFALGFFPVTGGMTSRIFNLIQNDGNQHCLVVPCSPSEYIPGNITVPRGESSFGNIRVCRESLSPTTEGRIPGIDYWRRWRRRSRNARQFERVPGLSVVSYAQGPARPKGFTGSWRRARRTRKPWASSAGCRRRSGSPPAAGIPPIPPCARRGTCT